MTDTAGSIDDAPRRAGGGGAAGGSDGPAAGGAPMTRWLWLVGGVILTAGILFGYDQGVISGALEGIDASFSVTTLMTEIITSWVTLGALVGALVAGVIADRNGRRPTILMAAGLFVVGALIEAAAPGAWILVVGRLVVGFGVGVASVAAPLLAAEMAPTRIRGRFVSSYQFGITFGIFIAYLVDEFLQDGEGWRAMLGLSAVPAVLLVLLVLPLPDTPRWYLKAGRRSDAEHALEKLHETDPTEELRELEASLADDVPQASWGEVFSSRWRRPLMIGVGLAVFQQITGINAIIYYADKIFAAAGFSTAAEQTAATTWAIGAVNVLATLIAIAFVDRLGRKPLLLAGLLGMGVSLTVVGISFLSLGDVHDASGSSDTSAAGVVTLVALVVYIASFAFSLGPVVWTMINEVFPRAVRGRGVAFATAVNWGSAFLVSQFFLSLTDVLGESGTFWLFAGFCVIAFVWIARSVPETKGRTLEEIEHMFGAEGAEA